ncbi:MAG: tetratricopeptide repeat protein [Pseudonocardia sp.]
MRGRDLPGSALGAELAIARAGSAARRGELDEAERLLRNLETTAGPNPTQLDLLARVHAQRGHFAEADECWARIQADDPENVEANAGRAQIADISAGRHRARPLLSAGRVLVIATAICLAGAGVAAWGATAGPVPSVEPLAVDSIEEQASKADALARQLADLQARRAETEVRTARAVDALAASLAFSGVRVTERPDGVQVVFDEGLFARSDRLTDSGAGMLAAVGKRLVGQDVSTTVVGHTVVVPGGPDSGGSVVALARALVAARELAESSGTPLATFELASADQAQALFPEPARNRTVTLLITPNLR